jgi:hypothetical protein
MLRSTKTLTVALPGAMAVTSTGASPGRVAVGANPLSTTAVPSKFTAGGGSSKAGGSSSPPLAKALQARDIKIKMAIKTRIGCFRNITSPLRDEE